MEQFKRYLAALVPLATLHLATCQQSQSCSFEAPKDFNDTAFYLHTDALRFRYPDPSGKMSLGSAGDAGLRIVCPAGMIMVGGDRPANLSIANVECVGGSTIKLTGTFNYSPLNMFGCSGKPSATVQLTGRKTSDGKNLVEIGYGIGLINFLPVVDEVAVNSFKGGYTPRWAHFKATPVKANASSPTKATLKTSPLSAKVSFEAVYDAPQQRTRFAALFNDATTLVDKYMPADGSLVFVPSPLISSEDLYYENQKVAAAFYDTTVPVWNSVESGNWKRVGEVVRRIAADSLSGDVDVWSGAYLQLWLRNVKNKTTYVDLPEGVKPPQFLFKIVDDVAANRGVVFITVNNPHLTQADKKNVICEETPVCRAQYPEFSDFKKGFTYCCSLAAFKQQAKKLGLPAFKDTVKVVF